MSVAYEFVITISFSVNMPDLNGKSVTSSCSGGGSLSFGIRQASGIESNSFAFARSEISSHCALPDIVTMTVVLMKEGEAETTAISAADFKTSCQEG